LAKTDGSRRTISIPKDDLRAVQDWLLGHLLSTQPPAHPAAHGYVSGKSIRTCAEAHIKNMHAGGGLLVALDLTDCYGHTERKLVYTALCANGLDRHDAALICQLCLEHGHLPQGAPTSPVLLNLALASMDARLSEEAELHSFTYTRYADDLYFSQAAAYGREPALAAQVMIAAAHTVTHEFSHTINVTKTRVLRPHQRQEIVGIICNNGHLAAPRELRRTLRAALYRRSRGLSCWDDQKIRGMIAFVKMIDSTAGAKFERLYSQG
jgi:hypothetical protein